MEFISKSHEDLVSVIQTLQNENFRLTEIVKKNKDEFDISKSNDQSLVQRIINLLPIRVFWKDTNLVYLGCNEIFAKDAGEQNVESIIGKNDHQLAWSEQAEIYRADDRSVIETGISKLNYEEQQTTPSGEKIWLRTSKVPLTDYLGNTIGILGTYEDVTEQKKIEALKKQNTDLLIAKEKTEKMAALGTLVAGISHEINNPLNFIKGGIDAIESELTKIDDSTKEELEVFIDIINEGVNRASAILKGLSHYSRSNDQYNDECDVHKILENCLILLNSKLKNRVEVKKQFCDSSFIIQGNDGELHQAFLNILSNAEQAISTNGVIRIETSFINGHGTVIIRDNGSGISKENLSKIGNPFFTTKAPGEGTGLGLSITYKIIERHGGEITVNSELTKGTEFILSF